MRITKAELKKTLFDPKLYTYMDLPEIAVVGRSNVGKSSLINHICNNHKLARISSQPGKTRSVNFYTINNAFYLTDLPGYGFARRSAGERQGWSGLVDGYFAATEHLIHLLLLCDIRHDASVDDLQMAQWLRHYQIPYTLICTKSDKIAKSKRPPLAAKIAKQVEAPSYICFSASEGLGKEGVLRVFDEVLSEYRDGQNGALTSD